MIRMVQSTSAGHAKAYFNDALSKSDYYMNDQELAGRLCGRLGERLGLGSDVSKDVFFSLCENRDPNTGNPLTPMTRQDRTVGYDVNFHAPKSVSIVHALSKDGHIADAFQASVNEVMQAIEADCQTRVRKNGAYENRATDELLWAEFLHQTARPVDDAAPDPHLHIHAYVFNMTWDKQEKRVKAAQFRDIKRDMPYYQALFHKALSDKLIESGYAIRKTAKSFEIEGVPQQAIDLFSKRTNEIGQYAKLKGIHDPKKLGELGALTRAKKQKGLSMPELKSIWRKQIGALKGISVADKHKAIRYAKDRETITITSAECVDHAVRHSFERASVMAERRFLEAALRHGIGDKRTNCCDILQTAKADERIIRVKDKGRWSLTTKDVLQEEKDMVELAKRGKDQVTPLYHDAPEIELNGQQKNAVLHILTTPNRVSIIRGAAGTGKTTLMKEAKRLMEAKGKNVVVVAPTAEASKGVLVADGFQNADTVARLLTDKNMQDGLNGQVLWVDEAGLLGTKDMTALLRLAANKNAQLILGGDTRQHASVVRGDALRVLNTVAGIRSAEVSKIYRQKTAHYKHAVEDLSQGKIASAFERLETIGAIQEVDALKPNDELVNDYVALLKKGKSALVVSPTHKQGDDVTDAIREKMKAAGLLGKKEVAAIRLVNLNLTEAQKADWRNFSEGQVVQFNQNVSKIKRGSQWIVARVNGDTVTIADTKGEERALPWEKAHSYDVLEKSTLCLAKGDKIKITRNGFDDNKNRLNNGQTLDVVSVDRKGKIKLRNGQSKKPYEIGKEFGHLSHAHCITSYAAQGKTVDHVLIAQPASTFAATDARQFYVSVSRGRETVRVYTDDKAALLDYASHMGDRQSAIELVQGKQAHLDHAIDKQRNQYPKPTITKNKAKGHDKGHTKTKTIDLDYEP
jgi:conjugative relaxase-like TrwC/TraI family protein